METTLRASVLITTVSIWDQAKPRSIRQSERCASGSITDLTGSSFTDPSDDPEPDQTVGVLARALGLWVLNACRVVYVVEEQQPILRFGFGYGTLPEHAESGEERFQVEWREDDSVWYDILAFSRPNQWCSRIAYPYVRHKQRRFAKDSMLAMKAAVP